MNICVDASLVVKWLVPEDGSEEALKLYRKWTKRDETLIAPGLIDYEVGTSLRQKIIRKLLSPDDLFPIFDFYERLGLLLFHIPHLVSQAVPATASLNQPTIYDIAYLLTAKKQGAIYVTADERFHKSAHHLYSFVKFYKDSELL